MIKVDDQRTHGKLGSQTSLTLWVLELQGFNQVLQAQLAHKVFKEFLVLLELQVLKAIKE
jgi:hypothetical protein